MQVLIKRQDAGVHVKGDFVEIQASGTPFAGKDPDDFVLVNVPSIPMSAMVGKDDTWQQSLAFEVVTHDAAQDAYRLRLYAEVARGALGAVTRSQVEAALNSWGASVVSAAQNEVILDVTIFDALTSAQFWEFAIGDVGFTEQDYDQGTGVHRIAADYSEAMVKNTTYVEVRAERQGVTIVSHADRLLVFDGTRADVVTHVRDFLQYHISRRVARRRYYVNPGVVDYIVGQGGSITTDLATLQGYVKDKMVD